MQLYFSSNRMNLSKIKYLRDTIKKNFLRISIKALLQIKMFNHLIVNNK